MTSSTGQDSQGGTAVATDSQPKAVRIPTDGLRLFDKLKALEASIASKQRRLEGLAVKINEEQTLLAACQQRWQEMGANTEKIAQDAIAKAQQELAELKARFGR